MLLIRISCVHAEGTPARSFATTPPHARTRRCRGERRGCGVQLATYKSTWKLRAAAFSSPPWTDLVITHRAEPGRRWHCHVAPAAEPLSVAAQRRRALAALPRLRRQRSHRPPLQIMRHHLCNSKSTTKCVCFAPFHLVSESAETAFRGGLLL